MSPEPGESLGTAKPQRVFAGVYGALSLVVAVAFAFPLFLAVREIRRPRTS